MYLYLRWLIYCLKVALGGRSWSNLLAAQKSTQNSKSFQKVATKIKVGGVCQIFGHLIASNAFRR